MADALDEHDHDDSDLTPEDLESCPPVPEDERVEKEKVFRLILDRKHTNDGKLDSMVYLGPQPFLGMVPFNRFTVWCGGQTYVYIGLHGCFKQDLATLGGKAFCPACNTNTNVRCKGPMMSRIRQIPDIPAPCNVLYDKLVCENCTGENYMTWHALLA